MAGNESSVPTSRVLENQSPSLTIPKSPPSESFYGEAGCSTRHIRFPTPPSSPEFSLTPDVSRRVQSRAESPPSALTFLAAVCSSPSVRWDGRKHHYFEGPAKPVSPQDSRLERDASRGSHVVDSSSPGPAYSKLPSIGSTVKLVVEADTGQGGKTSCIGQLLHYPTDEDQDDEDISVSKTGDYYSEFTPSSPTAFSLSSPYRRMSHDVSSSSERSTTLPLSSPGPVYQDKQILSTAICPSAHDIDTGTVSQDPYDVLSVPHVFPSEESHQHDTVIESLAWKKEPQKTVSPAAEQAEYQPSKSEVCAVDDAAACSIPPSLCPPEPSPLTIIDFAFSPLSSLLSSPPSETIDEAHLSVTVSRSTFPSSTVSPRSASPNRNTSGVDVSIRSKATRRRSSMNINGMNVPRMRGKANTGPRQRSDTAPPEPTPRKRQRPSSPSSPIRRPLQVRRITSPHSPSSSRSKYILASNAGLKGNRLARGVSKAPAKKVTSASASSSSSTFSSVADGPLGPSPPQSTPDALHRPSKCCKSKLSNQTSKKSEADYLASEPQCPSSAEFPGLPMTGFLVETLALSRASAMAAPELLRAVLKSQPHLLEERTEKLWLNLVRCILEEVRMFGRIEREGTDAADRPLEDQWFYIPEYDEEDGRAELLKGLMPKKRDVTKRSKQYYFEPVQKVSRWDPEDD